MSEQVGWAVVRVCAVSMLVLAGCSSDRRFLGPDEGVDAARDGTTRDREPLDEGAPGPDVRVLDGGSDAAIDAPEASVLADVTVLDAPDSAAESSVPDARDGASADGPASDGAVRPSPRCATAPTLDGVIGDDWSSDSVRVTNALESTWGARLNELRALRVCYDSSRLYLGIEGVVESGNAIVAFIDRDFGSASGIGTLSVLRDRTGALDTVLSGGFSLGEGALGFAPEAAWGTLGMGSLAASETSERVGLRLFFPVDVAGTDRRTNFAYPTGVETRCRDGAPGACEVAIAWNTLYELGPGGSLPTRATVALAVRIANGLGDMSPNQTLPSDDATNPRRIGAVLAFDARF